LGGNPASTPVCHIVRYRAGSTGDPGVHVGELVGVIGKVVAVRKGIIRELHDGQPLLLGNRHSPVPIIEPPRMFFEKLVSEAAVVLVIPRDHILRFRERPSFAKPAPRIPQIVRLPCLEPDPVRKRHGGKQTKETLLSSNTQSKPKTSMKMQAVRPRDVVVCYPPNYLSNLLGDEALVIPCLHSKALDLKCRSDG
jgi:hypothetical protein